MTWGVFILVALLFCILLAWPGRRRWPWWLIVGLTLSVCTALTFAISANPVGWRDSAIAAALGLSVVFVVMATLRDLRDPTR